MSSRRLFALFLLLALIGADAAAVDRGTRVPGLSLDDHAHGGLVATGKTFRNYIPPPPGLLDGGGLERRVATFDINYNPSSCPAGTTTPWTTQARNAFAYAASIWAAILNANVTIEIDACWRNDLAANVLGSAGPESHYRDFTNAPQSNTFYPVALANHFADEDLNDGDVEINARFNSTFTWYFGTDGNTPADEVDFVSVVLHEIGHGLGFAGTGRYDDGTGNAECSGTADTGCVNSPPRRYDRFVEDNGGQSILSYSSPSTALGNAITSDNLFFDGTAANFFNGGQRVELYAPTTWDQGSSYSHLGEVFNGTEHALMTFALNDGEANHYPGRVTLGLFQDLGWDIRNLGEVWVDASYSGEEIGGPSNPFNTFSEGVQGVYPDGILNVRAGNYDEQITIIKAMFIRGDGPGTKIIGGQ